MKTVAMDRSFIDYWVPYQTWYAGVRVWSDHCQAIATKPGETPNVLRPTPEPEYPLPLSTDILDGPKHTDSIPLLTLNIMRHCGRYPASDLRGVLSGEISFEDALKSAETSYRS